MASSLPSVLVLDHSFIRRLRDNLCSHFDSRADVTFGPSNDAIVHLHGVGGHDEKMKLAPRGCFYSRPLCNCIAGYSENLSKKTC